MPTTCFLIAENTLSAEKAYLTQRITKLGAAKMDAVCRALATSQHRLHTMACNLGQVGVVDTGGAEVGDVGVAALVGADV